MTINEFAVQVSKIEGGKKQTNISQIMDVLNKANKITDGELYRIIRKINLVKV